MGKLDLGQWTIAFVLDSGQVDRSSGCGQPSEIFHHGVNDMTILSIKDFSSSKVATV